MNPLEALFYVMLEKSSVDAQRKAKFRDEQIECLAKNIYFEARNQSKAGKYAVAWVTQNRVDSSDFPNTICKVVYQRKQFSWYWDGLSDVPQNPVAWAESQEMATNFYNHHHKAKDITHGALFYHAHYANVEYTRNWGRNYNVEVSVVIDDHIFYKPKKKKKS